MECPYINQQCPRTFSLFIVNKYNNTVLKEIKITADQIPNVGDHIGDINGNNQVSEISRIYFPDYHVKAYINNYS